MAERVVPPTAQPARSREKAEAWAGSDSSGVVSSTAGGNRRERMG